MLKAGLAAAALVGGCAAQPIPVHGEDLERTCHTAGAERFVGRPGTRETGAAILRATGSAVIRWARPGMMMTMDFRTDRVTVRLGPDGRVTSVSCG